MNALLSKLKYDLVDDWYKEDDPTSKDRLRLLKCQYTSNIIRALITGTFWTGLLLCLNADDASIGTIGMISSAAGMLQMLGPLFLERFKKRKTMIIWLRALMWLFNVVIIGIVPLLPFSHDTNMTLTVICVLMVNILNTVVGPGTATWHLQSMPEKVRGGYYSLLTMTNGALIALVTLAAGLIVDAFGARGMEYYGILVLRGAAALLCVLELYMYRKIPEYPYDENPSARFNVADLLIKPFKNKTYLLTVAVGFLWNFIANIPGSYYSVYLLSDEVGLSYSFMSLIGALNVPFVLFLTPIWKRILKKTGWFKTCAIGMAAYFIYFVMCAFVDKRTAMYIYPLSQLFIFFFSIGVSLSFTGIHWVNIPVENRSMFYGFYQTAVYLASFAGVTAGKYFVVGLGESRLSLLGFIMGGKQLLCLMTGVLILLGALIVWMISNKVNNDA